MRGQNFPRRLRLAQRLRGKRFFEPPGFLWVRAPLSHSESTKAQNDNRLFRYKSNDVEAPFPKELAGEA